MIVLDLRMPVMDGWQFRVEQKRDPSLRRIPVIALSGDASAQAAAIDAEVYLAKPVLPEAMVAAVDRLILELDRRALDAQMAQVSRLSSLGTLAAGMAHEINNPLAYVLLNLTFLEKELSRLPYADQETNSDLMMPVASLTMRLLLPAGLGFELHSFDCNRRALGDGQPNRIALLLGSSQIRVEHEGVAL